VPIQQERAARHSDAMQLQASIAIAYQREQALQCVAVSCSVLQSHIISSKRRERHLLMPSRLLQISFPTTMHHSQLQCMRGRDKGDGQRGVGDSQRPRVSPSTRTSSSAYSGVGILLLPSRVLPCWVLPSRVLPWLMKEPTFPCPPWTPLSLPCVSCVSPLCYPRSSALPLPHISHLPPLAIHTFLHVPFWMMRRWYSFMSPSLISCILYGCVCSSHARVCTYTHTHTLSLAHPHPLPLALAP